MEKLLHFVVIYCGFVCSVTTCPLNCACTTTNIDCYDVNLNTIYYNSQLITDITFVDSIVDVSTLLQKYSHLQRLTFVSSRVLNCPKAGSVIIKVSNILCWISGILVHIYSKMIIMLVCT